MKKIEAVVRVEKLQEVKQALEKRGYPGMMVWRIEGHGRQKGLSQQFRGREYRVDFLPKIKLEIVVRDDEVENIVKTIVSSAKTGEIGDGKIFVSDIDSVVRIRTFEKDEKALY